MLDLFPVFELLIKTAKAHTTITHEIDISLWDDNRYINKDIEGILDRLRESSDDYLVQTLSELDAKIDIAMSTRSIYRS